MSATPPRLTARTFLSFRSRVNTPGLTGKAHLGTPMQLRGRGRCIQLLFDRFKLIPYAGRGESPESVIFNGGALMSRNTINGHLPAVGPAIGLRRGSQEANRLACGRSRSHLPADGEGN